jgi:hypothetical protein
VTAVLWAITAVATAAAVWHAVTEHHVHLRLLRRLFPGIVVPQTSHDTWWHSLPRSRRIIVQAALMAAGLGLGIASEVAPTAAITALGGIVATGAVLAVFRTLGSTRH